MTEEIFSPPADEPPGPVTVTPTTTTATTTTPPRRNLVPLLYGLGFLILAAAIYYVWQNPKVPAEVTANSQTLQSVAQRLTDTDGRLNRLEQRPGPDLGKINARLDALDGRIVDQTQLASRLDAVSGRIESLSGRDQTGIDAAKQQIDATKQQIDALAGRVAALESKAGSIDAVASRLNRIARLQEASFALTAGRPVGDVPNAPAALARYATAAPPTEAQLRLHFPDAEQAALATKQPGEEGGSFVGRAWDRAQGLMTIRRGDEIVIGSPVATTLGRAQTALDAGDLSGAVAAVETLNGQPAQAMAHWLEEAKGLIDARSALDKMADQA